MVSCLSICYVVVVFRFTLFEHIELIRFNGIEFKSSNSLLGIPITDVINIFTTEHKRFHTYSNYVHFNKNQIKLDII